MRTTVEVAPLGPRPAITLRPAPPCEPPFDDELEPAVWATAHQLTLDLRPDTEPACSGSPPAEVVAEGAELAAIRSAVAGVPGDAKLAVRLFLQLLVEVFTGHRPAAQLRKLSRPINAADIVAQGLAGAQRVLDLRKAGSPPRRSGRRFPPVAVLRMRTFAPRPDAVEVAVALVTGERTWAVALRLELHDQTWSATTLQLI